MKKLLIITTLLVFAGSVFAASHTSRTKMCIDREWQFQLTTTAKESPEEIDWSAARKLNLPHDWSVESEAAAAALPGKNVGPFVSTGDYQMAFTVGGEGWYRKTFTTSKEVSGKLTTLYFEGAYNYATVWVNGKKAHFNHYGYSPFRVDVTNFLRPAGEENEVIVRVQNKGKNTRWYAGSGIYRHVWLITTAPLHLDDWSTAVRTTDIGPASAKIEIQADVINESLLAQKAKLEVSILSPSGALVAKGHAKVQTTSQARQQVCIMLDVSNPKLWTPDSPDIYKAHLKLGRYDELTIPFGIRTVKVDSQRGFLLNGVPLLLKGGCVHHDNGLLGGCGFDKADIRRVALLKQNGYNAVRTAHNLPTDRFLQACDSIGLIVIDETFDEWYTPKNPDDYHLYFPDYFEQEARLMVKRDRNHPSVCLWSIGNEITGRTEDKAIAAAKKMREVILDEDPTRVITAAICEWDSKPFDWPVHLRQANISLDVTGYNYMYNRYTNDRASNPGLIICGTESYPKQAAENWALVEQNPYVIGDFVWTALDYVGEAGIGHGLFVKEGKRSPFFMPYPYYNGWCGDVDLIGEKKPQSYYRDVVWGIRPITMAMELPCPEGYHREISMWGWQPEVNAWEAPETFFAPSNLPNIMYDGPQEKILSPESVSRKVNVNVYARSPKVRLYLNDRLIGEKATGPTFYAGFELDYEPGTLKAVEWDGTSEGQSFSLVTCGEPVGIRLTADRTRLTADGADLSFVKAELVDAAGRVVHDYTRKVSFSGTGAATLLTAGNANPTDMASFRNLSPTLYGGKAMAIIQSDLTPGSYTLSAHIDGFQDASITLTCE